MSSLEELAAEYRNRPTSVDIGHAVSRGINLVTQNLGLTIGATWVAIILAAGVHLVPIVGWIAGIVLAPTLVGGLQYLFIRRIRGDAVTVGDLFAPFNNANAVIHLALAGLLAAVFVSLGMLALIVPGVYLAVCYTFALPLVLDKQLEFWPAMEVSRRVVHRHWWTIFGVVLVSAVIALLGAIALFVGLVITVPIAFAAQMCAYEDLFGAQSAAAAA
jgi:hypothetical protein